MDKDVNGKDKEDSIVDCIMCKLKLYSTLLDNHFKYAHLIQVHIMFNFIYIV